MNFSIKEYLPGSQERIEHLRKIVNGRPVAILAAGPSIQEFEERIGELSNADICYFGINNFFVQETHILSKIGKHFSAVTCSGREGLPGAIKAIVDFLNRNDDNMFISSFWRDSFGLLGNGFSLRKFLSDYDSKLIFFSLGAGNKFPNSNYPLHFTESNSLLLLIQMALIAKASSIVLFGADGHCGENAKKYYYRQNEYEPRGWAQVDLALINNTMCYFNPIAPSAIRNTCKTYGLKFVNVLNCSKNSFYTPFPKVSYDEAFEYLLTGNKLIGKLDLRFPEQPKLPNVFFAAIKKFLIFCKKYQWNSFAIITARVWRKLIKNQVINKENYAR